MDRHPKDAPPPLPTPFPSEDGWSQAATRTLEEQRRQSGGLPDDPTDDPVHNSVPYRNLR
jgi:hypothetical protein